MLPKNVRKMENQTYFPIRSFWDVESARQRGTKIALAMGFPQADAIRIATVISELGRNIERYAGEGSITLTVYTGKCPHIQITAEDQGPGIPNLDLVVAGGHSTSDGLGLGVSGSKSLMDEFEIQSMVGVGTRITVVKRLYWQQGVRSG
jgi:serine/threonine-protein kinase RsbT